MQVPLRMPNTLPDAVAGQASRMVLTIGMPPATDASKASATSALGEPRQIEPVMGKQRLVGGDHRLAGLERRLDRRLGRIALAAHQLDEDIDLGRPGQRHRIVMPGDPGEIVLARRLLRDRAETPASSDRAAGACRYHRVMEPQGIENARANRAEPGDADAQGSLHWGTPNSE